ncbi:VanZ family protein, partial [Streptomyces sp. ZEA17I]|uniref:VanZ family protein n=1 Tax=Streptomyces sp. ZEA17I TaxID=2202516 RepID=UPI00215B50BF
MTTIWTVTTARAMATGRAVATGRTALVSLGIEVTQLLQYIAFANGRAVDVNDLIANALGGLLGYAVLGAARRAAAPRAALERVSSPARRCRADSRRRLLRGRSAKYASMLSQRLCRTVLGAVA